MQASKVREKNRSAFLNQTFENASGTGTLCQEDIIVEEKERTISGVGASANGSLKYSRQHGHLRKYADKKIAVLKPAGDKPKQVGVLNLLSRQGK